MVGDSAAHQYCFVEFEDAGPESIFKKAASKSTSYKWSARFEAGFSQLVDWILRLEGEKNPDSFRERFGSDEISYIAVLIIGRDHYLTEAGLETRLKRRNEHVFVHGHKVNCTTFDALHRHLKQRLDYRRRHP